MTEIKNVGRMEQVLITGIAAIITTYLAGGAFLNIELPSIVAWVLALLVVSYFLNRMWMKIEQYIDNIILIARLNAEQAREITKDKALVDGIAMLRNLLNTIPKDLLAEATKRMADESEEPTDG